jgi:GT2 family glycosyltransferase
MMAKRHYFTSVAASGLPKARVMARSLRRHDANATIHLVLCDVPPPGFELAAEPFDHVHMPQELAIPRLMSWLFAHEPDELRTAMQGPALWKILTEHQPDQVYCFAPDVVAFAGVEGLAAQLAETDVVLAPHPTALDGFAVLGVRPTEEGLAFANAWREQLLSNCFADRADEPHGDASRGELARDPFAGVRVLRDEASLLTSADLDKGALTFGDDDSLLVDGKPIAFFACDAASELPALRDWYARELDKEGQQKLGSLASIYANYFNGQPIDPKHRRLYRSRADLQQRFPRPFDTDNEYALYDWMKSACAPPPAAPAPNGEQAPPPATTSVVRTTLERAWQRTLGATDAGKTLGARARQLEERARPLVWRGSAPLRRFPPAQRFLAWLANSTKHHDPPAAPKLPRPFTLPTPDEARRKMARQHLAMPTSESPEISIVVPVYNHFAFTYACLGAIAAASDGMSYEVLVVDDCSSDETPGMLASVDGIRVLRNDKNLGFIGACNAGARAARGSYLVFLNNDTEVQPRWLAELRDTFDANPTAGLVGAKLIFPDGRLQEAGGLIFGNAAAWNYGRLDDPDEPRYSYLRRADYCSGAAIMIPRALFESLGGFDTEFAPAYYEDTDLAFRVRAAGREVLFQPLARVTHFEGLTSGTDVSTGVKQYQRLNEAKFAVRWLSTVQDHRPFGEAPDLEKDRGAVARILVVDLVTPQPDCDSGSLRRFNFLQVLRRLGLKVTFLSLNTEHLGRYTSALQRHGIEVLYAPYVPSAERYLAEHAEDYDLIMICRAPVAEELFAIARAARRPRVIFDTVDLHYLREEREARVKGDTKLMKSAQMRRRRELEHVRLADCTLVVSPVEQQLLAREVPGARVRLVSNIHEVPGSAAPFAERRDLLFVGLFRHTPNVDAAQWFVREVLPRVHAQIPDAKLFLVGIDPPAEVMHLAGPSVVVTGHVPDLDPYLRRCLMTVAPLRYGAGVKGKINLSLSHGVPVVATRVAVEGLHIDDGREALVADDPQAFADAIVRLHRDPALWSELSRNGVAHSERHFSFAVATAAVRELLAELLRPETASRTGAAAANVELPA